MRALCIVPNNLFKKQDAIYKYMLNYLQKQLPPLCMSGCFGEVTALFYNSSCLLLHRLRLAAACRDIVSPARALGTGCANGTGIIVQVPVWALGTCVH